ncbi:hypothetical protein DSCW_01920 [Desulfosarcina widdelii]|uniref:Uncharacterized protein n=1 Tax=Desulfosarcina widdelii TaxID=947919 RepID=A0A5K7YWK3_9BACT|nr:hypothetical protein DSCW_01920 [Desulfosarcina widdelii]
MGLVVEMAAVTLLGSVPAEALKEARAEWAEGLLQAEVRLAVPAGMAVSVGSVSATRVHTVDRTPSAHPGQLVVPAPRLVERLTLPGWLQPKRPAKQRQKRPQEKP